MAGRGPGGASRRAPPSHLDLDDFRSLCEAIGGIVSWEDALDYLHQTGVVFHRPDLFANRIVLDQDWALDAVYTVFHRDRVAPLLRDLGSFTRRHLALLAWPEHSLEDQRLFLGLMENCGICSTKGSSRVRQAAAVHEQIARHLERAPFAAAAQQHLQHLGVGQAACPGAQQPLLRRFLDRHPGSGARHRSAVTRVFVAHDSLLSIDSTSSASRPASLAANRASASSGASREHTSAMRPTMAQ